MDEFIVQDQRFIHLYVEVTIKINKKAFLNLNPNTLFLKNKKNV